MVFCWIIWISAAWKVIYGWSSIWRIFIVPVVHVLVILPARVALGVLGLLILILINLLLILVKVRVIRVHIDVCLRLSPGTDVWVSWLLSSMVEGIGGTITILLILTLFFNELLRCFLIEVVILDFISVWNILSVLGWLSFVRNSRVLFRSLIIVNIVLLLCSLSFFILLMPLIDSLLIIAYNLIMIDTLELFLPKILLLTIIIIAICPSFVLGILNILILIFNGFLNLLWFKLDNRLLRIGTLIGKIDIRCSVCILIWLKLQESLWIRLHLPNHMLF